MQAVVAEAPKEVPVDGWGTVHIRALTVAEVEQQIADGKVTAAEGEGGDSPASRMRKQTLARGAARLLCDESGKRLFDPDNAEDVALLASQPWAKLRKLLDASDDQVKDDASGN